MNVQKGITHKVVQRGTARTLESAKNVVLSNEQERSLLFDPVELGEYLGTAGLTRKRKTLPNSSVGAEAVKVFIADGSQLSCELIAAAVRRGRYRTRVVGFATDAVGIREGLEENKVDVAVIGARLEEQGQACFNVTREILASHSSKPNIIIILDSNKPTMVVEAFRAGASGIFSTDQSSELLCKCIHAVHEGQVWASSKEWRFVIDALGQSLPAKTVSLRGRSLLTKREEGVVHLVAEGMTNRDISQELKLSEHTVRNCLFRIFNKVGASNRLELALYAIDRREGNAAL